MSSKPPVIPLFDTGLVNVAAPAGGRIASGYPTSSPIPSSDLNYLFGYLGLWAQYLSDGTFSGTTTLNGLILSKTTYSFAAPSPSNVDFSGISALTNVGLVRLTTGVAGPFTITGIAGGAEGRILLLWNQTADTVTLFLGTGTAGNQVVGGGWIDQIVIPANGYVALHYAAPLVGSATWNIVWASFRPDAVVYCPVALAYEETVGMAGATTGTASSHILSAASNQFVYPIQSFYDRTLIEWGVVYKKNTTSGVLTAKLAYTDTSTSGTSWTAVAGSTVVSGTGATGGLNKLGQTGVAYSYTGIGGLDRGFNMMFITLTPTGGVVPNPDRIWHAYAVWR